MPPPGKGAESAAEILKNILGEIAMASTLPDADPQFFTMLQQAVTQYLRKKAQGPQQPGMGQPAAMQQGPQQPPTQPPGGMGGGFGGLSVTGGMGRPGGPPPGPGPTSPTSPLTSPDELRRMLSQGA